MYHWNIKINTTFMCYIITYTAFYTFISIKTYYYFMVITWNFCHICSIVNNQQLSINDNVDSAWSISETKNFKSSMNCYVRKSTNSCKFDLNYTINTRKNYSADTRISSGLAPCNASLINVEKEWRFFSPFLMKISTADNTYHKTV